MSCNRDANRCRQAGGAVGVPAQVAQASWAQGRAGPGHCPRCGAFLRADGGCSRCESLQRGCDQLRALLEEALDSVEADEAARRESWPEEDLSLDLDERIRQALAQASQHPGLNDYLELHALLEEALDSVEADEAARLESWPEEDLTLGLGERIRRGLMNASVDVPSYEQYQRLKDTVPCDVLFIKGMGDDYYETFDQDARLAAQALGNALYARPGRRMDEAPATRIPAWQMDASLRELERAGYSAEAYISLSDGRCVSRKDVQARKQQLDYV